MATKNMKCVCCARAGIDRLGKPRGLVIPGGPQKQSPPLCFACWTHPSIRYSDCDHKEAK